MLFFEDQKRIFSDNTALDICFRVRCMTGNHFPVVCCVVFFSVVLCSVVFCSVHPKKLMNTPVIGV